MIKCPKCEEELKAKFNEYPIEPNDFMEIFFDCKNGHQYFTRVTDFDLIDELFDHGRQHE